MKKKVVPKLRQEVKVTVDIVTSDDIKIYYARKFQDFTARYIIVTYSTRTHDFVLSSRTMYRNYGKIKDFVLSWLLAK